MTHMHPPSPTHGDNLYCRGKVGRRHVPEVRLSTLAGFRTDRGLAACGVVGRSWYCTHQEVCTGCGKVTRFSLVGECPDLLREAS